MHICCKGQSKLSQLMDDIINESMKKLLQLKSDFIKFLGYKANT